MKNGKQKKPSSVRAHVTLQVRLCKGKFELCIYDGGPRDLTISLSEKQVTELADSLKNAVTRQEHSIMVHQVST